jgi:hypothetical protein
MNTSAYNREDLMADVYAILTREARPVLVSDLISALRWSHRGGLSPAPSCRRWFGINECTFEEMLRDAGYVLKQRVYAAGIAVYVSPNDFSEVRDRFGKFKPVKDY